MDLVEQQPSTSLLKLSSRASEVFIARSKVRLLLEALGVPDPLLRLCPYHSLNNIIFQHNFSWENNWMALELNDMITLTSTVIQGGRSLRGCCESIRALLTLCGTILILIKSNVAKITRMFVRRIEPISWWHPFITKILTERQKFQVTLINSQPKTWTGYTHSSTTTAQSMNRWFSQSVINQGKTITTRRGKGNKNKQTNW